MLNPVLVPGDSDSVGRWQGHGNCILNKAAAVSLIQVTIGYLRNTVLNEGQTGGTEMYTLSQAEKWVCLRIVEFNGFPTVSPGPPQGSMEHIEGTVELVE